METLEFKSKDGHTFTIRGVATRGDQIQMKIATGESTKLAPDGKSIQVNPWTLYPWLVERFVTAWSGGPQKDGAAILRALSEQPADPEEDLIFILGAYIFNHVRGLTAKPEDEAKKKG